MTRASKKQPTAPTSSAELANAFSTPVAPFTPVLTQTIQRYSDIAALPSLLLVGAPTGYGKTVFASTVARTLQTAGHAALLHSLDEGDADFGATVMRIEALLGCESEGVGLMFCASPMIETDSLIDSMQAAAARLDHDAVLIIDGFDPTRDAELAHLIERLLLGRQTRLHVIVTGIDMPPDQFHRLRLEGKVQQVRPTDLALNADQIRTLFETANAAPLNLTPDQARDILLQTEGWPAAVRLMHVAMSSHVDPQSIRAGITLDTPLTDTLARRVLGAIDPEITNFLFEIADLNTFHAELCAHVTQNPRSAELLAELIRLNLMIFPATGRPGWYRFHGLFSNYLRREAHALRSEAERHAVLARALDWCRRHNHLQDAFEFALAIHDGGQAGELLAARAAGQVRDHGRHQYYISAYERLLAIDAFPSDEAQYWYVWAMVFARQYEKAYRVLASMRHREAEGDELDERMAHRKQAVLSVILFSLDRIPEARQRAERWLEADDGLDPFETSGVACVLSTSGIADHDIRTARRAILTARKAMSRTGSEYGMAWISCLEALIDVEEGDLTFVDHALDEAIARARNELGAAAAIVSTMDMIAARMSLERGDVLDAKERVLQGLSQAKHHGFIETAKIGLEVAVRLWDGTADSEFAPRHLDAIAACFPPRLQLMLHCAVLVRLVRLGRIDAATDWVRRQDLEESLSARPPAFPAAELASARRALLTARIAWLIAQRDFPTALSTTEAELRTALKGSSANWQVQLLLIRLEIEAATGHTAQASKTLLRTTSIAASRRILQPFIEYADVIRPLLLADPKKTWPLVNEQEIAFFNDMTQRISAANASAPDGEAASVSPEDLDVDAPTSREVELLGYLDSGLSNQEIADRLGLTVGTVKWHLHNLYLKLRVRNRSAAIFRAKRAGLLNR
ncbi:LuxR C-terminal-related transcriptional regulator [Denitromonas ohlonensis]|uniref:Winged helix-turn-helix transcriptional regulator n=2 Tax=Denitromonas TaxID=139331 RepID=A0A558ECA0_9RHOO|nr:LuxR C-terminal-related transcriptional regulator [Denitromonas ohlonensis]TVT48676.1 MAG: winged helix-turn-helix transcriptional regulator [Denitromonas halophila]TVO63545.1 winged helix-turn-helix transcriptional regulator [Denitromonas ohlonensis]TVO75422.1 winged helix-turn-helix transcriptional regulator [Denitromonas ohlonensis]TVT70579.1 MAG: winged helix-turn-helix transcriptional regulator [Denitromonas halophila]TVT75701.1 MAG: winged helix-turn-helix transcriptional regulator [D